MNGRQRDALKRAVGDRRYCDAVTLGSHKVIETPTGPVHHYVGDTYRVEVRFSPRGIYEAAARREFPGGVWRVVAATEC